MKVKEFCSLIDSKLEITTEDGKFEGLLKFVLMNGARVTFEHVFELPSREYLGTVHLLYSSISKWKVLETAEKAFDTSKLEPSCQELLNGVFVKNERIDGAELVEISPGSSSFEHLPSHLKNKCPGDYCIIDSVSDTFFKAAEHLFESSIVGVSLHGPKISRCGHITWVCISTSTCVFFFDIQRLGNAAFRKGLKIIFESNKIEKVVHDCREVADCLVHMFNTKLKNVFDTQVADYLINMQMYTGKEIFKYVSSLDSCLFKYLKVPQQFLYNRNKCALFDDEIKFFEKRPITDDFINVLLKSTMYLLLLKERQQMLLLFPYEQAVDFHLNSLRRATDSEVYQEPQPNDFSQDAPVGLIEGVKSIRFQEVLQPPDDFINQFKETLHGQKAWKRQKTLSRSSENSKSDM